MEDYTPFQLVPLTFESGSVAGNEECHVIAIMDDTILENDEVFSVRLTSGESAFLESNSTRATVIIRQDPADCKNFNIVFPHHMHIILCRYRVMILSISLLC